MTVKEKSITMFFVPSFQGFFVLFKKSSKNQIYSMYHHIIIIIYLI